MHLCDENMTLQRGVEHRGGSRDGKVVGGTQGRAASPVGWKCPDVEVQEGNDVGRESGIQPLWGWSINSSSSNRQ